MNREAPVASDCGHAPDTQILVRHYQERQWRRSRNAGTYGHAPNAMDNFCFDITLSYRRLERPRRSW